MATVHHSLRDLTQTTTELLMLKQKVLHSFTPYIALAVLRCQTPICLHSAASCRTHLEIEWITSRPLGPSLKAAVLAPVGRAGTGWMLSFMKEGHW